MVLQNLHNEVHYVLYIIPVCTTTNFKRSVMLTQVGVMLTHVGVMLTHVGVMLTPCR